MSDKCLLIVAALFCLLMPSYGCADLNQGNVISTGQSRTCQLEFGRLKALAEQGDAKAQYKLGTMYYFGHGVPQDYWEAVRWYRKAA